MNKTYLPYDFILEDKIIIELDGPQHFKQVSNWQPPEETHLNDLYKMKCAKDNGYSIIRLLQTDVFYDTYDWLTKLRENIEKIKLDQHVQNVYMCKNNEYAIFK
jgi:very-short-patch-repair endonuclease